MKKIKIFFTFFFIITLGNNSLAYNKNINKIHFIKCKADAELSTEGHNITERHKTKADWEKYFKKNIDNLDPIEGIWNLFFVIEIYENNRLWYSEPSSGITQLAIVKNGDNFEACLISQSLNGKLIFLRTSSNDRYLYDILYNSTNTHKRGLVDLNDNMLLFTNELPQSIVKSITQKFGLTSQIRVFGKYKLIKVFPTLSDKNNSTDMPKSGTGFAISSNGYIVTNFHVINGAKKIEVKGINHDFNHSYAADIVVTDKKNDLAILRIDDPHFTKLENIPFTIRNNLADVGEKVFTLGYPLTGTMGTEIKLTNGIISSRTGFKGDVSTYQITVPVQPGNSGGPLFDNSGNLIGIINAKYLLAENVSYAIKVSYLKNLIDLINSPINLPTKNIINIKTLPEKVKILSNFIYIINVNSHDNSDSFKDNDSNQKDKEKIEKTNVQSIFNQALSEYRKKDMEEAYKDFTRIIELNPNYTVAYLYRGIILLYYKRNYDLAIENFTKCIQMNPNFTDSYLYRGISYYRIKKYIDAIKDYTACIEKDSNNTDALFLRALIKSELNDKKGAINDYDKIIKLDGKVKPRFYKMATVYNNKAYTLVSLSKYTEALPLVNKALSLDKSEGYIWDTRGEIYYYLKEYTKCIQDMNKAISLQKNGNSFFYRGLSKIKLGKDSEGCSDLSKAGELGKAEAYEKINQYCNRK